MKPLQKGTLAKGNFSSKETFSYIFSIIQYKWLFSYKEIPLYGRNCLANMIPYERGFTVLLYTVCAIWSITWRHCLSIQVSVFSPQQQYSVYSLYPETDLDNTIAVLDCSHYARNTENSIECVCMCVSVCEASIDNGLQQLYTSTCMCQPAPQVTVW